MCMAQIFGGQQGVRTIQQSGYAGDTGTWAKSGRPKGGGFTTMMRGILLRQNGRQPEQQAGSVTGAPTSVTGG